MGADVLSGTRDHISSAAVDEGRARIIPAGSVALVIRSGILDRIVPVTIVPFATALNQDMKALSPSPGVDARWVAWALRAQERQVLAEDRKAGTTVASLDSAKLLARRIPLPTLTEQRRVVDILEGHLSRLDAADAGIQTAVERTAGLKRSVALRGLLGESSNQYTRLIREITEDVRLPHLSSRTWGRLGELADVVGGVTKDSKRDDPSMVEVPYLRVANVQRMRLDLSTITTIRVPAAKADALRLRAGDVLLNEGGDRDKLARGWIWEGQIADCIHQNHVYRARPDTTRILSEWLAWSANYLGGEWAARHGRQSVNLASISLSTIRRMPIPLINLAEQRRILDELSDVSRGADRLATQGSALGARAASLRRAVLIAAFSGRLTGRASDTDRIEELADASNDSR